MKRIVLIALASLMFSSLFGRGNASNVNVVPEDTIGIATVYFRFDSHTIDSAYMDNARSLAHLDALLGDEALLERVLSVTVSSSCSPDGNPEYNARLSQRRTASIYKYVVWRYPLLDRAKIVRKNDLRGYWDGLRERVEGDSDVPGREALLGMIDDRGMSDLAKTQRMTVLDNGRTFAYLKTHILRHLRNGVVVVVHYMPLPEIMTVSEPDPEPPVVYVTPLPVTEPVVEEVPVAEPAAVVPAPVAASYPLALRSNLLTDAVAAPNFGVEVPLGRHFSAAADFTFAYWSIDNLYALQTLQGGVEGRYWFRPGLKPLTGWNAGLYGMYSSRYDVQWKTGYQGDGYWSAGVLAGYSIPLRGRFNLDLSIGGGIWYTPEVRKYSQPESGHLIWEETRYNVTRFALTRARVNLVWLIGHKKETKR